MNRRTFLKMIGIGSLAFAPACSSEREKNIFSYVRAPEDMVTGEATWFASTCRECPAGCGIIAKNREGRVIKVEGNPLHPINMGKLCVRGQASVQGIFNPDRIKKPLLRRHDGWQVISFKEAEALLGEEIQKAAGQGKGRLHMITEVVGESLMTLFRETLEKWGAGPPLVFEPFALESLKAANEQVFGLDGIASIRMEKADFLLSFGADFLETWLSPVEYARKFKAMHALDNGQKGFFAQISPYQSLTCANADLWLPCHSNTEVVVGLGLIREALQLGKGKSLPADLRAALEEISFPYNKVEVPRRSGVDLGLYQKLISRLDRAMRPLALGAATSGCGEHTLRVNMIANLLNAILDPELSLLDLGRRHRVETAAKRAQVVAFFGNLQKQPGGVLLLNQVNPVYAFPPKTGVAEVLKKDSLFTVSFSNFMDETTLRANLVFPVSLPMEGWDEYSGTSEIVSMVQPAMASLTGAPGLGDLFLRLSSAKDRQAATYQEYLYRRFASIGVTRGTEDWVHLLRQGGLFDDRTSGKPSASWISGDMAKKTLGSIPEIRAEKYTLFATPSIRFYDGRGANRPWLCEVPDPLTRVAWQTPVWANPRTLREAGLRQGDVAKLQSAWGTIEAPVYETEAAGPGVLVMSVGQGHELFGRYAEGMGSNPIRLLSPDVAPLDGSPLWHVCITSLNATGRSVSLSNTDGSRVQHGRKIALSIKLRELGRERGQEAEGLAMWNFPMTLPLPEAYDPKRDIYASHEHDTYRWAMVVDLDRCVGCNACAAACYGENNIGVVGINRVAEGREMAWLSIERYLDQETMKRVTFLPMLCQHCDNAPCESVCPVFAPHHSKEGLNNQIYNRCIGTRFCSQNCPYKVRRFNWFDWDWPKPLNLQLNPDVTVRSKGVMEKCSFCIQRIKEAHGRAKDEKREIRDGEVQPACLQTCPTGVFTFGNLKDKQSRVRKLVEDRRAYQVMGYLNTKPAVIYLKKVVQEI